MLEILQYDFMRNALLAGLLASIACGIVGTYIVVKKMVFISGGIAHCAYGGIGLGYFLGFNPIWGAVLFSLLGAYLMGVISKKAYQHEDTITAIMWSMGMALGIIFIGLTPGYAPDLFGYLFGSILTVPQVDIIIMLILDIIILFIVFLLYKEFLALCFDEEFAIILGIPAEKLYLILLGLIALTVVILIRVVGVILVIALLSIPAAISKQFTSSLKTIMFMSIILGVIFTTLGLGISYIFDLATGATIILLAGSVFILSIIFINLRRGKANFS